MTLSDEELRGNLERLAADAPTVDLTAAARIVASTPQPRGSAGRVRLVGLASAAAFAAVALVIVGSIALRDNAPASNSPGQSSGASSTASVSASPTTSPIAEPWTDLVWGATDPTPFSFGVITEMTDGVADGDGFLAIGSTGDDERTNRLWRSPDGRAWTVVDGDWFVTAGIRRVLKFGTDFIIIGGQDVPKPNSNEFTPRTRVWWSEDGADWVDRTPEGSEGLYLDYVTAGPSGVLLRFSHGSDNDETWFRGDAQLNWTRIEAAWPQDSSVFGIAANGTGWLAYGETGSGGATGTGAIWTSADAVTWVPARVDDPGGSVNDVQSIGNRLVALGSRRGLRCAGCLRRSVIGFDLAAWVSSDGRSWQRASEHDVGQIAVDADKDTGMTIGRVAAGEDRILTFEPTPDGLLRVWQTVDGFAWSEVGLRNGQGSNAGGPAFVPGLGPYAMYGPGLLIVGRHGLVALGQDATGAFQPMYAEGVSSVRLDLPTFAPLPSPSGP